MNALAPLLVSTAILSTKPMGLRKEEIPDVCAPIPIIEGHNCVFSSKS